MIVFDKNTFGSKREIDEANGYLRVEECNISKCQVRPYLGREIPNWREFDLEPDKIYNVYCPREELKKAVPTFNNLPLTREHIEVDVDNVPKEKIVGSLGDHASFEYPYLKNNLIIYDKKDIDLVMSGKKKELSCGYRYTPVRQSGEAEGQHYDFVMTDIIGNHVALVKQGRAGRDVMVADSSKGILETIKEKIMAVFDNDLVGDEFKESEHPRAKNGQFTTAGGSGSEKKEESSEKDIIESLKNKFPRKSEKKDGASEYKKERLKDVEAVSGRETEFYKAKEKEVDEDIKEAKEYVSSVIKKDAGEYKHGKDYFKHQVEKTKNRYGEESDYYKMAKLHLDLYNEMANDSAEQEKVGVVMKEFKEGELKSGSGEKVTDPKQAIAIALSEADQIKDEIPEKQDEPEKAGDEVALNKGEKKMADEVKETPAEEKVEEVKEEKVTEDACKKAEDKEVKPACDEKEDKRKLIDEIGGILKDKLSEEEWRTVIKKAEELAYNDSEASADDEKCEEPKGEIAGDEEEVKVEEKEEEKAEEKEMAKDEALVMDADAIKAEAKAEVIADFKARETARRAVRKMVGDVDVFAFDSADEIYKFACEKAGMNLNEIVSFKDAFCGLSMAKGTKLALDASPNSGSNVECFKNIRIAN